MNRDVRSGTRVRCSLRNESSSPRQLEIVITPVNFVELIGLKK